VLWHHRLRKGNGKKLAKATGMKKSTGKKQQKENQTLKATATQKISQNKGTASKNGGAELSVQSGEWAKKDYLEAQQMRRAQLSAKRSTATQTKRQPTQKLGRGAQHEGGKPRPGIKVENRLYRM